MANRLLRTYGEAIGLDSDFTVMDQSDAEDLMDASRQGSRLGLKRETVPPETCLSIYSRCVNSSDRLDHTRERFDHILVDEYQDTNRLQSSILHRMRSLNRNLTVVGDDAQSIYSFRAAEVRKILDFSAEFPEATVVTLETNYRSTQFVIQRGMTHEEAAMPAGEIRCDGRVPDGVSVPGYGKEQPAVFFGHYCLAAEAVRDPLASNVACLDYSAGYGGPLVAYRFDGKRVLNRDKFVAVK